MEAQSLLDHTARWTEHMYDMEPKEIEDYFAACGRDCNKIVYIEYQYYQIGLTNKWLEDISAKIGDKLVVRREILLQRLQGSSLSPYPQEDLEYIVGMMHQPIKELWLLDYYRFDIYSKLNPKTPYIVGVDCSTGTLGDNNAITIIDPYTVEPVAEFECSYIGETKYCNLLIELVTNHIPRAVLAIERNSVGDAIIDFLLNSKIRNNLYYDKNKDFVQENMKQYETSESLLKKQAVMKSYYGVFTGSNGKGKGSRDAMFAILSRHVNEYKEKFITKNIIRDLTRLVKTPSGAIKAGNGVDEEGEEFHDDSIMSYLIALYVYYHGNNLEVFGIYKGLQDTDEMNKGLKRADEIDPSLVRPELIEAVRKKEELEEMSWAKMMEEAIQQSQKQSYQLHKSGMVNNEIYVNTPDNVIDDINDDNGGIPLDFFDSLNQF